SSEAYSFTTEDSAPRWVYAEGLTNIRDIGAWPTMDGKKIKQGLLYRGSEMDTHLTITPEGIRTLKEHLTIRTDLDLRGEAVGRLIASPLGEDVQFILIPVAAYSKFTDAANKE